MSFSFCSVDPGQAVYYKPMPDSLTEIQFRGLKVLLVTLDDGDLLCDICFLLCDASLDGVSMRLKGMARVHHNLKLLDFSVLVVFKVIHVFLELPAFRSTLLLLGLCIHNRLFELLN